jgi:hypothetical protein
MGEQARLCLPLLRPGRQSPRSTKPFGSSCKPSSSPQRPRPQAEKSPGSTIDVVGLVVNFDQQHDHINEANIKPNLLKVLQALVRHANNLARRPSNGEASETFTYSNEFQQGTDYTRALPRRRHLGQVISPEDSVTYMERIFDGAMTFDEMVSDHDIMAGMYGTVEAGNALIAIARPTFVRREDVNHDDSSNDGPDDELPTFVAEP